MSDRDRKLPNWPTDLISSEFSKQIREETSIFLVNLSTADGFRVSHVQRKGKGIQSDKVAAVSSSLCALSNSAAAELLNSHLEVLNVESPVAHAIFLNVSLGEVKGVLTLCASADLSLAQARFYAKRLKEFVEVNVGSR